MKYLLYVWTFWVMILSVTPCCAWDRCDSEKTTVTNIRGNDRKTQTNDETKKGTCSPFFACASCSGFVNNATIPSVDIDNQTSNAPLLISYVNNYCLQIPHSIWQPPQIS